ncbi:MAG: winged helix-turn-helix domain-containing protein [Actinomycetota bacterium]|nr:winged helix-turn-helix domain-containing protein [Actinomycetota bacterium]
MTDHTGSAAHSAPDYPLVDTLTFDRAEQFKALFEETRLQIVDLLMERAATIKELSDTLGKPKGTIGHHVGVLEEAGLIEVVRTKKVRAIEAKYYGRTARTYLLTDLVRGDFGLAPDHFLSAAASEYAKAAARGPGAQAGPLSTLRYARIPDDRAEEWSERLKDLVQEFTAERRGGDTTYGLLIAMYPTDRPHLPEEANS